MKEPIIIGLTGGIGSGKSTVARIFETLDYPVFYADDEAKKCYLDASVREEVIQHFGQEAYDGEAVNRAYLAQTVFNNPEKLKQLNGILHPAVRQQFANWHEKQSAFAVLREAAILFESGSDADCTLTITVSAPEELRIRRVTNRDGSEASAVRERMRNQLSDAERAARADYEIVNDGVQLILPQVLDIDAELKARYGAPGRRR